MSSGSEWVLYGATGFTGRLLAEEAVRRGHRPLLAGRSEEKLAPLADRLGLPHQAVSLSDAAALGAALKGKKAVLHAAGPFARTSQPMVAACLEARAHYLDLTGELPVFRQTFALDPAARSAKVALICGVGFDVIPTDCLAREVVDALPGATALSIAIAPVTGPTAGTAKSAMGMAGDGFWVRRGGALVRWPVGKGARPLPAQLATGGVAPWGIPVPLGDLEAAFRSTGVPDITAYLAVPPGLGKLLRPGWPALVGLHAVARALLGVETVAGRLERQLERRFQGPDERLRERGSARIWACAERADGERVERFLETIEPYRFTQVAAIRALEGVLARSPSGALSPALALGADFVRGIEATRG